MSEDQMRKCACCGEPHYQAIMTPVYAGQGVVQWVCPICSHSKVFSDVHAALEKGVSYCGDVEILPNESIAAAHTKHWREHPKHE